ncbi:MAG: hypothetical protein ACR2MX_06190 [Cyclobacteriaceae bacterium]
MKTTAKYLDKLKQVTDQTPPENQATQAPQIKTIHDRELVLMRIRHILQTAQATVEA